MGWVRLDPVNSIMIAKIETNSENLVTNVYKKCSKGVVKVEYTITHIL